MRPEAARRAYCTLAALSGSPAASGRFMDGIYGGR